MILYSTTNEFYKTISTSVDSFKTFSFEVVKKDLFQCRFIIRNTLRTIDSNNLVSKNANFEGNSGKADIDVEGLLYEDKSKNKAIGIKDDGENKIKVQTSSGDLKLK